MVAPEFEKMANEFPGAVFVKVDVDAQANISQMCGIRAMPTFQFFKNGVKVDEVMGANVQALREKIQSLA